jgi:hypothetical protein
MPPYAASIWSAATTEIAIVISAWRRSWPWFQRRNTCWSTMPSTPMISVAISSGTSQPIRLYSPPPPPPPALRLRFSPPLSS